MSMEEQTGIGNPEFVTQRAYAYLRVSTEEQATEGFSLDNQRSRIEEFARNNNITIVGWYADPGISGRTVKKRPDFLRMLKDCMKHKGEIDCIIAYSWSRYSRGMNSFLGEADVIFAKLGIRTLSVIEPNDKYNLSRNISLVFAQYESDIKSDLVRETMGVALRQGWWIASPPLGYRLEKVEIKESDGKTHHRVKLMPESAGNISASIAFLFSRFSEGDISVTELTEVAKKLGIRTRRGNPLDAKTLVVLLKNPVYAGFCIGDGKRLKALKRGEKIQLQGESITDFETWSKVQSILNAGKRELYVSSPDDSYPLKGYIRCHKCGKKMIASAPTGGSGKRYPRYHCRYCRGQNNSIDVLTAHNFFLELLEEITPTPNALKFYREVISRTLIQRLGDAKAALDAANKQKSDLEEERLKILKLLAQDKIKVEEKDIMIADNQKQTDAIKVRIMECEKILEQNQQSIEYIFNFMANPAKLWRDADATTRKMIQTAIFPDGFSIDIEGRKCGTDKLSPLYSVISNKKEHNGSDSSNMVCPIRFERTTFSSAS